MPCHHQIDTFPKILRLRYREDYATQTYLLLYQPTYYSNTNMYHCSYLHCPKRFFHFVCPLYLSPFFILCIAWCYRVICIIVCSYWYIFVIPKCYSAIENLCYLSFVFIFDCTMNCEVSTFNVFPIWSCFSL